MKSVKLRTCIHIVGKLSSGDSLSDGRFYEQNGGGGDQQTDHHFDKEFRVIPKNTLSYPVNDSMTISLIHSIILETPIPPF
jgi:hypothetical protein